ncbi:choice-of-anchor J domain-containing protein [Marinicella sediminis]|uniref:Choice-of-anchor J domain-containing protein n=1 Tax=Marinicella sediminis TaxID=1792834 RepID=A0ABV7JCB0_9GAMM|nr:choice-of-anchor J domain-containing protein [Marinicella sediminis]
MNKHIKYSLLVWAIVAGQAIAGGFEEGFENINQLTGQGWVFDNRSDFIGDLSWNQGFASVFPAEAGPDDSYILGGAGQTGGNVLCDWLILPDIGFVEQLNFFTRTETGSMAADRLMVVHSPTGSTNTGPCITDQPNGNGGSGTDFGDFQVLASVNPDLVTNGYPQQWTAFHVPVNGAGRLALVYFVENVSQAPFNGNLIGIDSLSIGPVTPAGNNPIPVPGLGLAGILVLAVMILMWFALLFTFNPKRN